MGGRRRDRGQSLDLDTALGATNGTAPCMQPAGVAPPPGPPHELHAPMASLSLGLGLGGGGGGGGGGRGAGGGGGPAGVGGQVADEASILVDGVVAPGGI